MVEVETPYITRIALKEWAITQLALAEGAQTILLRKGGIEDEEREFRLQTERFLLYPTYEHQRSDLLKEPWRERLGEVLSTAPPPGRVVLSLWARVENVYPVSEVATLEALSPHYLWTVNYARERLRWQGDNSMQVLLVRCYRLKEPTPIAVRSSYGGCRSWIELEAEYALGTDHPAMTDVEFAARKEQIERVLV